METLSIILLVLGFVLFLLAALGVRHDRVDLIALGLAAWILVPLIHAAQALG